jgi:hypothetical protein
VLGAVHEVALVAFGKLLMDIAVEDHLGPPSGVTALSPCRDIRSNGENAPSALSSAYV